MGGESRRTWEYVLLYSPDDFGLRTQQRTTSLGADSGTLTAGRCRRRDGSRRTKRNCNRTRCGLPVTGCGFSVEPALECRKCRVPLATAIDRTARPAIEAFEMPNEA